MRREGLGALPPRGSRVAACACLALLAVAGCGGAGDDSDVAGADADVLEVVAELTGGDVAVEAAVETAPDTDVSGAEAVDEAADDAEAWVASCPAGSYYPGAHEAAYDGACAGNVGCKHLTCQACATSCELCDGPRCIAVVTDDSCMVGPAYAAGWAAEPSGGVPSTTSGAVLAMAFGTVVLQAPGEVPVEARWIDAAGAQQSRALAAPVEVVGDRLLVAGSWSMHNYCTGQDIGDTLAPALLTPAPDGQGQPAASWPAGSSDPWVYQVAWIRVYRDADGLRAFQWIEPAQSVSFNSSGLVPVVATTVTAPLPADVAKPLGVAWGNFDWAAALP